MWNKTATAALSILTCVLELLFVTLIYFLGWSTLSLKNPTFSKSFDLMNRKYRITCLVVAFLFLVSYIVTFILASEADLLITIFASLVGFSGLSVFFFLRLIPKDQDPNGRWGSEGTIHGILTIIFFMLSPVPLFMLGNMLSRELYVPSIFTLASVLLVIVFVVLSESKLTEGTVKFLTLAYGFELIFAVSLAIYFGQLSAIIINSEFDEVNLIQRTDANHISDPSDESWYDLLMR